MNTINKPKVNVILIIIFVIISGIITYFLINNKISSLNKANDFTTDIPEETNKKKANDTYLGIKLGDTYNQNDLSYKTICSDGENEYELENYYDACDGAIYLQFDGLKNKTVLNKINEEIKNKVYDLKNSYSSVKTNINGNFSNILSIDIIYENENDNYDYKRLNLNYDLNTGDKIKFLDLFTSDTPINSIIAKSAYENLAWSNIDNEYGVGGSADMDEVDTKEYEDEILKVINKFQVQKDNIDFSINPSSILIYNITDTYLEIEYKDCKEYVALFKRYAFNNSLYEENNIGLKNIIIMTTPYNFYFDAQELIYGFITDNFYADVGLYDNYNIYKYYTNSEEMNKKVAQDVNSKLKEMISSLKKEASNNSNEGLVFQVVSNDGSPINDNYPQEQVPEELENGAYASVEISYIKFTIPQKNFKSNLLDYLVSKNYQPKASVMQVAFYKDEIETSTYDGKTITYYYDINGNYVGNASSEFEPEP